MTELRRPGLLRRAWARLDAPPDPNPPLPGEGGSVVDALHGAGPRLVGALAAAVPLAAGAHVGVVVGAGATGVVVAAVPGIRRARRVRAAEREAQQAAERRRADRLGHRAERWEAIRADAATSARRFRQAVDRCTPGPVHDRLVALAPDVEAARHRVGELVEVGLDLEDALLPPPPPHPRNRARRSRRQRPEVDRRAVRARRNEVEREASEAVSSLRAIAALTVEVSTDTLVDVAVGSRLTDLVVELDALRSALADLRRLGPPT